MPTVSVIMPAYNAEQFIAQAIESILNQTYRDFELLICDDGSTDATYEIAKSYKDNRIKVINNNKNLGYLKTCNRLFSIAKGDYIAMHDADDFSLPTRFEEQIKYIKDYAIEISGVNIATIDEHNSLIKEYIFPTNVNKTIKNKTFEFVQGAFMFKREVLSTIGGYHVFFNRLPFEDWYWTFLCSEKYTIHNIQNILYYYRKPIEFKTISNSVSDFKHEYSKTALLMLIDQRINTGTDDLEQKNYKKLKQNIFVKMLWRYKNSKDLRRVKNVLYMWFKTNPFDVLLYKELIYLLK